MGYLTTLTIYNDGIHSITTNSDEFCENLLDAALSGRTEEFGHGCNASLVKVQTSRHANDPTIYVQMGNTLSEMCSDSPDTVELMKEHPEFFKGLLNFMKLQVSGLEDAMRELDKEV